MYYFPTTNMHLWNWVKWSEWKWGKAERHRNYGGIIKERSVLEFDKRLYSLEARVPAPLTFAGEAADVESTFHSYIDITY